MATDFTRTRAMFDLPDGMIYLDGNSLGPLPRAVAARVQRTIADEWGQMLITGWNKAGWMDQPARLGDRIARLIGAEAGHVVLGDTLSIKVYQALASALEMNPQKRVILSDTGNFPSDLYMAEGLCRTLGPEYVLKTVAPEDVAGAIDANVAVLLLTEVDYRTGRRHDLPALTARAHAAGALAVWDLAHSAGATDVVVGADLGCGQLPNKAFFDHELGESRESPVLLQATMVVEAPTSLGQIQPMQQFFVAARAVQRIAQW